MRPGPEVPWLGASNETIWCFAATIGGTNARETGRRSRPNHEPTEPWAPLHISRPRCGPRPISDSRTTRSSGSSSPAPTGKYTAPRTTAVRPTARPGPGRHVPRSSSTSEHSGADSLRAVSHRPPPPCQ
jgi:hypothetical protein